LRGEVVDAWVLERLPGTSAYRMFCYPREVEAARLSEIAKAMV